MLNDDCELQTRGKIKIDGKCRLYVQKGLRVLKYKSECRLQIADCRQESNVNLSVKCSLFKAYMYNYKSCWFNPLQSAILTVNRVIQANCSESLHLG